MQGSVVTNNVNIQHPFSETDSLLSLLMENYNHEELMVETINVDVHNTTITNKKTQDTGYRLQPDDPNRRWVTTHENPLATHASNLDLKIELRTRSDGPWWGVPDKLYSSLRYEFHQTATSSCHLKLLLCKLQVVDAETGEEIGKGPNGTIDGETEKALTLDTSVCRQSNQFIFSSVMRFKVTTVTYHHRKRPFAFQFSYYLANDTTNPILVKRSQPFQVFARRAKGDRPVSAPTTTPVASRKRKSCNQIKDDAAAACALPATKKAKQQTTTTNDITPAYRDFAAELDNLFQFYATSLTPAQQKTASSDIMNSFMPFIETTSFSNSAPSQPCPLISSTPVDDFSHLLDFDASQFLFSNCATTTFPFSLNWD